MRRAALLLAIAAGITVAGWQAPTSAQGASAGAPAPAQQTEPDQNATNQAVTGGRLHGVVKSGNIPLPGVTVTAQNTLTGKKFSTTTDITGAWSMNLPQNGRYVIRTQFAAFAMGSQEAVLNASSHDQTVNFQLILASRAAEQEQQANDAATRQAGQSIMQQLSGIQQLAGNGAESVSLMSALSGDTYLLTYTLLQDHKRLTRRATIWRNTAEGWKAVYHQGTIVQQP